MSIDDIGIDLEDEAKFSSGNESKIYENIAKYLRTNNTIYLEKAKQYYNSMDIYCPTFLFS